MTILAKPAESRSFDLAPEGEVWAVLTKVSEAKADKDGKPRVAFTWEACNRVDGHGKPFKYFDGFMNSLYSEGRLAKMIEAITGSKPDPKSTTYDLEDLVGIKAELRIEHKKVEQKTYANVAGYRRSEITDEDLDAIKTAEPIFSDADEDAPPLTEEGIRQYV